MTGNDSRNKSASKQRFPQMRAGNGGEVDKSSRVIERVCRPKSLKALNRMWKLEAEAEEGC